MVPQKKHIFLSGFMGTGKTTIARLVANKLNLPHADTDQIIEQKMGCTIAQIIKKKGEDVFRFLETKVLLELCQGQASVTSVGGGVVLGYQNRCILMRGVWININLLPATLYKRLENVDNRPLLGAKKNREKRIAELLNQRRPLYQLAPHQLAADGLSAHAVGEKIVRLLSLKGLI